MTSPGRVSTFDVFDTCVRRAPGGDRALWAQVARAVLDDPGDRDVAAVGVLRGEAERTLLRAGGTASLGEVWDLVAFRLCWPPERSAQARDTEVRYETEGAGAIVSTLRTARAAAARGVVAYVSETAHTEETIRRILDGLHFPAGQVFTSASRGRSKRDGLYPLVVAELGVAATDVVHRGDSIRLDVVVPRLSGIRGRPAVRALLGRRRHTAGREVAGSGLVETLRTPATPAESGSPDRFFQDWVGAWMVVSLAWATRLALVSCGSLVFVARDGFVLKSVADVLIARWGVDVPTRYLLGSRTAWEELAAGRGGGYEHLAETLAGLPPGPVLVVDVGWTGQSFRWLREGAGDLGDRLQAVYVGAGPGEEPGQPHRSYFELPRDRYDRVGMVVTLEAVCGHGAPRTEGFASGGEPVSGAAETAGTQRFYRAWQEVCRVGVEQLLPCVEQLPSLAETLAAAPVLRAELLRSWHCPGPSWSALALFPYLGKGAETGERVTRPVPVGVWRVLRARPRPVGIWYAGFLRFRLRVPAAVLRPERHAWRAVALLGALRRAGRPDGRRRRGADPA